jgi:hypothetical protein
VSVGEGRTFVDKVRHAVVHGRNAALVRFELWNDQLVEHGRHWLFLVLLGFVVSFAFIRMSTRLMRSPRVPWWPGSVNTGGVHLHHPVLASP